MKGNYRFNAQRDTVISREELKLSYFSRFYKTQHCYKNEIMKLDENYVQFMKID